MSATLNRVELIGRFGRVGELRRTTSGTPYLRASLATDRQSGTDWHELAFWGSLAEIVSRHARKGRMVFVDGSLSVRTYVEGDQNRRWVDVRVRRLLYLDAPVAAAAGEPSEVAAQPDEDLEAMAAEADAIADIGALG